MRFRDRVNVRLMVKLRVEFRDMRKINDIVIVRVNVMVSFKV